MNKLGHFKTVVLLVAAGTIAGCGGGGGGGGGGFAIGTTTATTSEQASMLPSSALGSVDGLMAYMQQLMASSTRDTGQPVQVGNSVLPVDDMRQPVGL